jgi:hypothetical protein
MARPLGSATRRIEHAGRRAMHCPMPQTVCGKYPCGVPGRGPPAAGEFFSRARLSPFLQRQRGLQRGVRGNRNVQNGRRFMPGPPFRFASWGVGSCFQQIAGGGPRIMF